MQVKLFGSDGLLSLATGVSYGSVKLIDKTKKRTKHYMCDSLTPWSGLGNSLEHKRQVSNGVRGTDLEIALQLSYARNELGTRRTGIVFQKISSTSTTTRFLNPTQPRNRGHIQEKVSSPLSPEIHFSCMHIKS
jgi:hypothetical protein